MCPASLVNTALKSVSMNDYRCSYTAYEYNYNYIYYSYFCILVINYCMATHHTLYINPDPNMRDHSRVPYVEGGGKGLDRDHCQYLGRYESNNIYIYNIMLLLGGK